MRVLLAWLANFAWILYAACAVGAVVYVARAVTLQRRMAGSLTTFERDTTGLRSARLWRTAVAFVVVGVVLFVGQVYLLPRVMPEELLPPTPTRMAGLETAVPSPSPIPTQVVGILPTVVPTSPPAPPPPSPEPTVTPTPEPAGPAPAFAMQASFGDVAELLGYDLAVTEIVAGQPLGLTLYWRALGGAGAADYVVFTHLLPPDISQIVAQHDSQPVGGTRPTTTWSPGEVIVDYHELVFIETGYTGETQIAVGFYIAGGDRVTVAGGGDYLLLPTNITVVAP